MVVFWTVPPPMRPFLVTKFSVVFFSIFTKYFMLNSVCESGHLMLLTTPWDRYYSPFPMGTTMNPLIYPQNSVQNQERNPEMILLSTDLIKVLSIVLIIFFIAKENSKSYKVCIYFLNSFNLK